MSLGDPVATASDRAGMPTEVHRQRLFLGSCVALIATSVSFATVGAIMLALKREFVLTNAEVGWIGGAALWGFAVSQLVFAPLADTLGMRALLRMSFLGHLVGPLIMIFAPGFTTLFVGALVIAMANGLVEAACNPLVATLYPDDKTVKLNQFHVWFPGGAVLGGLAAFGLDTVGVEAWQVKLGLVLLPTLAYGVMMLGETFPATEGRDAGVSVREMFGAAFGTPLMWVLLIAMTMTASVEIGPNRWVPAVVEAGGMPGILVLVWISGIMAVLRLFAGPIVHALSPTGILLASAVVTGIGLASMSYATSGGATIAAATVFAVGICYIWPTMLGVVSERVPRSGALGLGLMGTVGMATVGLVTAPAMGAVADRFTHERLPVSETAMLLEDFAAQALAAETAGPDVGAAITEIEGVRRATPGGGGVEGGLTAATELPSPQTATALRAIIAADAAPWAADAQALLGPADNYGGRISFRYLVPLCWVLMAIFGVLWWRDRSAGGYRATRIEAG